MAIGLFEIAAGGFLAAVFGYALFGRAIPALRAARNGNHVTGTVVRVVSRRGGAHPTQVLAIAFSTADGRRVEFTRGGTQLAAATQGDAIPVRYDPARPRASATLGDIGLERRGVVVGVCLTVCCLAIVALGVVSATK